MCEPPKVDQMMVKSHLVSHTPASAAPKGSTSFPSFMSTNNQRACKVDGCIKPCYSKGFCHPHYDKNRLYGDPLFVPPQERGIQERNKDGKRICTYCKTWKELGLFYKQRSRTSYYCKECRKPILAKLEAMPNREEKMKAKTKRWLATYKKASLIRKEYLHQEDHEIKSIWDGRGRWSFHYSECVECISNLYRHHAGGLCVRCYGRLTYQAMDAKKRNAIVQRISEVKKYRRKKDLEILEMAEDGRILLTPKMENILAN